MVKGLSRRVVLIKSPDPELFEEAIFILKDDSPKGMTSADILHQAQKIAASGVTLSSGRSRWKIPAPFFTLLGAGIVALVWLITVIA